MDEAPCQTVLKENLLRHPRDRDALLALISFTWEAADLRAALDYAQRLAAIAPGDPNPTALIDNLRSQIEKSILNNSVDHSRETSLLCQLNTLSKSASMKATVIRSTR
jgi:hypothetical protein